MKIANLKTAKMKPLFNVLQQHLGGTLTHESKEYSLELDEESTIGEGRIRGFSFKGGISYLEFDLSLTEDLSLIFNTLNNHPIYFAYCSQGSLTHSYGTEESTNELKQFQTGILTSTKPQNNTIHFKKDSELKASIIIVNTVATKTLGKSNLNDKLRKTFFEANGTEDLVYIGSCNLQIAEKIKELENFSQNGIAKNLMIEGIVHIILAIEIQQHSDDLMQLKNNTGSLTSKQMEKIKELSDFICNYPELQFTLKYLGKKSGLSPAKLQEGFKLMHNKTVTDYIRDVRVEKAEQLIRTSDMNISEIVYSIGLTSRSYFSKIFKKKYNCSPKRYKIGQNSVAVTA